MSQSQFADPLATTGYDVDPWSGTQSPSRVSTPALPVASTSAETISAYPALDAFMGESALESRTVGSLQVRRPAHRLSCFLASARSELERRDFVVNSSAPARDGASQCTHCGEGE